MVFGSFTSNYFSSASLPVRGVGQKYLESTSASGVAERRWRDAWLLDAFDLDVLAR